MNVALRPSVNIISLCTGGTGLDLGVELAMPCARSVVLVEREAFAVSHLVAAMQQGLLAQAPVWSDVTTFNGRPWRGIVDGVIGGIPCQPHSLAGKRLGKDDERDLWSDARRIIVQSGAWFVFIENVRGMVTSGGFERVWRDLRRLGFEIEPGLFTAAEVGASHQRERLFVLAVADRDHDAIGRQHGPRCVSGPSSAPETEVRRHQRQRMRSRSGYGSEDVAHADCERLERFRPDAGAQGRPDARRSARLRDGTALVHAECPERRAGFVAGCGTDRNNGRRQQETSRSGEPSGLLADAIDSRSSRPRRDAQRSCSEFEPRDGLREETPGIFPPSPSDLSGWRSVLERAPELEPAFRRVADGLASRLDIARVDRLRMLGNGVVSLEGAYAFRTLATRLAARGATGAARLVRVILAAEEAIQEPIR